VVHGEVVGLMNGELVMGGILEGDCVVFLPLHVAVETVKLSFCSYVCD